MVRKHVKRLLAFGLAAVVTATSVTPSALQNVLAAENVDDGNPFGGQNVALGKEVTISYPEGYASKNDESQLVDGDLTGGFWEAENYTSNEYPVDIVVDLKGSYLLDHVSLYWRTTCPGKIYDVLVSADGLNWKTVGTETDRPTGTAENETLKVDYVFGAQQVQYVKLACKEASEYQTYCLKEIGAYTIGALEEEVSPDQAKGKVSHASLGDATAKSANDGNSDTRWETGNNVMGDEDTAWYYVDLGEIKQFNAININFSAAFAKTYTIETATEEAAVEEDNISNGEYWNTIESSEEGTENLQFTYDEIKEARYVKLTGKANTPAWGLEIYDFEVKLNRDILPVEAVYLSRTEEYDFEASGETLQLFAQALPANAPDAANISWTTSDASVATVTDGLVTAVGNGAAVITAEAGGKKASINVMFVTKLETPVVTAQMAEEENRIDVSWNEIEGASYEIYRIVDGVQEEAEITSDINSYVDTDVVPGNKYVYKVRAVVKNGETYAAVGDWSIPTDPVTVPLAVDGVTLNHNEVILEIKSSAENRPVVKLTAAVLPDKATNKNVTWKSDDASVATVDAQGNVTAVAAGETTVTVTTEENSKTADCRVIVKEQLATPAVTAEKTGAQEITLTWRAVENADTYQIYRAAGKNGTFEALSLNRDEITVADGTASYTDTIDENEIGNVYSYKVAAVGAEGSYYTQSEESTATAFLQIGQTNPFGVNVAEGKNVKEITSVRAGTSEKNLVDGDLTIDNYWESQPAPDAIDTADTPQEVDETATIDLGGQYDVDRIKINWRPATRASVYQILVSDDGEDFVSVGDYTEPAADNVTDCTFEAKTIRYVRIQMTEAQSYGCCGICEVEVYTQGTVDEADTTLKGILISQNSAVLKKGEKLDLYAQKLPANAAEEIVWESDAPEVATVTAGKVTAVDAGVATITARVGDFEKTCKVIVTAKLAAAVNVAAVLESTEEKSVEVTWDAVSDAVSYKIYRTESGETALIDENVTATAYTDSAVTAGKTYSYQIVAVNPALSSEEDAIALYEDSDKSESSNEVTIPIHVTGVMLNKTAAGLTILPGKEAPTVTLTASIEPAAATMKDVTWTSDNTDVATVDENGVVTAVAVGTAEITATTKDEKSNASATCTITVTEKLAVPTVTAELAEDETAITVTVTGVDKADTYTLLKSVNNGAYEEVSEAALTNETLTYSDEDISAGSSYSYKVKAVSDEPEVYLTSEESAATKEIVVPVHVTEVGLNKEEATLTILPGEEAPTVELTAVITPENATTKDVTWTSDNTDVATVDENGVVTAEGIGTAVITAATKDEKSTAAAAACTVTVVQKLDTPEITAVKAEDESSITVTFKSIDHAASYKLYRAVDQGEYEEVMTELTPEDGVITYVDTELVKGKTYSYKVTALPESDSYLESEEVTEGILIPLHVEGVTLDQAAAELFVGGTLTLAEKITPADATIKDITWSTSDEKVAVVENGVVTAKAVGTATITVTTKDGEKTASCVITVKDNLAAPVVSVSKNGTDAVITWKAVANAASYDVFASVDGKTYTKLGNTTALTYTEKSISLSMHYYKVVAKGSGYYVDSKDSNIVSVDNNVVKVTKVSLNKSSVTINKGKTAALTAAVTPSNATNKAVTWKSSNTKVATVDKNGKVKAVGKGTATITVAAADGSGKKATCKVTVKVPATKVALNTAKVYVVKGKSVSLKATMTPSDTTDKITWKSSSKNVTIDKNGKLKAKKTGTVTITAKSTSGKKATCKVYVVSKATKSKSVKLNKKTASLKAGKTLTLKATMSPAKSTDTVKWSTSNKKIATVDAFGTVTAKKKGKVTITAKTTSGKKATCKITVK